MNHQRKGAKSNADVGAAFEEIARRYFARKGVALTTKMALEIGLRHRKKLHAFDLGSKAHRLVVECKSHKWTSGGNVPSAKLSVWNEAMFYFTMLPKHYRAVFFVLKDYSPKHGCTLLDYYLRTHRHMVPRRVQFYEHDQTSHRTLRKK